MKLEVYDSSSFMYKAYPLFLIPGKWTYALLILKYRLKVNESLPLSPPPLSIGVMPFTAIYTKHRQQCILFFHIAAHGIPVFHLSTLKTACYLNKGLAAILCDLTGFFASAHTSVVASNNIWWVSFESLWYGSDQGCVGALSPCSLSSLCVGIWLTIWGEGHFAWRHHRINIFSPWEQMGLVEAVCHVIVPWQARGNCTVMDTGF